MSTADGQLYDSRQKTCFIIPAIVTIIAILTYAARVFTRIKIVKIFGPEDWLCLVAVCASIVLTALVFAETYYGMGLHVADINPATASTMYRVGISGALREEEILTRRLQLFWVSVWIYNIALTTTKVSLLIQYMRLFAVSTARIVCWIVITATVVFGLFSVFGNIFLCTPVERWWDKSIPGHCLDEASVWLSNSGEYMIM